LAQIIICFEKRNERVARLFSHALKTVGHRVWLQATTSRLNDAVWQQADVCVFLLGLDYTPAMRQRLKVARRLKKICIPVLIEPQWDAETMRPGTYINATGNLQDAAVQLVAAVQRLTRGEPPRSTVLWPKWIVITSLLLIVTIAILLRVYQLNGTETVSLPTAMLLAPADISGASMNTPTPALQATGLTTLPTTNASPPTETPLATEIEAISATLTAPTDAAAPVHPSPAASLTPVPESATFADTPAPTNSLPSASATFTITPSAAPTLRIIRATPRARFSLQPQKGLAPLTVNFTNETIGSVIAYKWDFNDDAIIDSTAASPPPYVYEKPGLYLISLVASGPGGDSTPFRKAIVVLAPTRTPTPLPSPIPPTSTPLPTLTFTPLPSQTPAPTASRTPTSTLTPTETATLTPTPLPPTETETPLPTASATETEMPTLEPTDTPQRTPTDTETLVPEPDSELEMSPTAGETE
jgi:PKD repeat protein